MIIIKEIYNIEREFLFKDKIYEITSISVEEDHDINSSTLEGYLIVSGDYRIHEISINKEDFSFKIPFNHELRSNINLDTVNIEITDFSYELVEDTLTVNIEYMINAEASSIEFEDEQSLDEFLKDNQIEEVIDFTPEKQEEERNENIESLTKPQEEPVESFNNINNNQVKELSKEELIETIKADESYIKYHIHIVSENDTLETILNKYNITLAELKRYNSFENLELFMKLIIPEPDDE